MLNGIYPVFDAANTSTVINQTYLNGQNGATPMPIFIVMAGAALILLILAFREPMRNEMANINSAKVGLSLVGAIVSIITALASFDVVDNNGMSIAMNSYNYTSSITNYTIWYSPYCTVLFIISSILCSVIFIYTIIQPDILTKPDKKEYKDRSAE